MPIITSIPIAAGTVNPSTSTMSNNPWRRYMLQVAVTFSATATADIPIQLPAGHVVVAASLKNATAIVYSTAVKVGIGQSGASSTGVSSVLLSSTTTTKTTLGSPHTFQAPSAANSSASATTYTLTACATGGTAAGTITSGTFYVRIWYDVFQAVTDPA